MQEYHLHTKKSAEKLKQKDHQQEKTSIEKKPQKKSTSEKINIRKNQHPKKINIRKPVFRKIRIETEPDGELRSLPGSFVIFR